MSAELEHLARLLVSASGEEILLGSGRPLSLLVSGSLRPLATEAATTEQIVALLDPILTAESRGHIRDRGLSDFTWAPGGLPAFDGHIEFRDGIVFARLRRRPEPPQELLLQSDAPSGTTRDLELDLGDGAALDLDAPAEPEEIEPIEPIEADGGGFGAALQAQVRAPAPHAPPAPPAPMRPAPAPPAAAPLPGPPGPSGGTSPIASLLRYVLAQNASDLHLAAGSPPRIRLHGELLTAQSAPLSAGDTDSVLSSVLTQAQMEHFREELSIDFSFTLTGVGRFRANACRQRKGVSLVFRAIPPRIPTFAELGLPKVVETLTQFPNGLVLVTGPAGCGKSTTQAAILDRINETWKDHIITVEDPIEYVHPPKGCLVNQREVGTHVRSFAEALKSALREDPDVILVGELRDLETIQLAITAAETGHLVIGTLHTIDAAHTIDRLIDVFPGRQKTQIRAMVSESLRGVISQQLVPTADGKGRVAAFEILLADRSIANLIRESKTFQIVNAIRLGKGRGMCSLDDSLFELVRSGRVSAEAALVRAANPDAFRKLLEGARPAGSQPPSGPRPAAAPRTTPRAGGS